KLLMICTVVTHPHILFGAGLCCQLSIGVHESIFGEDSPETRKISLQLTYSFTLMDKLREGSAEKSVEDVMDEGKYTSIPTRMEMIKYTLTAAYGFTPRFSAFVTIPYIRNTMDMQMFMDMGMGMEWMKHPMDPVEDIGDMTFMGLYRIHTNREIMPTDVVTLGVGIKTPTGSSTEKTENGKFVHAHMQPGTGSWDPLISLVYTKMANPFLFQGDLTYQITTRNSDGYEFGDSFTANLSGKYAVSSYFNVTGGLMYLHLNRADDRDGEYTNLKSLTDDPVNTGGESVWLSPGIQVLPFKNMTLDLKVQFPLWERVNGIQLVSSYRILAGISYSFDP
ncbi:MAG: transporter, partial [Syntrophales bacterium]|nr:transporter [Syntrophales bacterium]